MHQIATVCATFLLSISILNILSTFEFFTYFPDCLMTECLFRVVMLMKASTPRAPYLRNM